MAKKTPVTIGSHYFEKKGDALEYFKEILNSYVINATVSEEHKEFLLLALKNHPDHSDKIGCGISHITVRKADFNTRCFWVNRTDSSCEKFSYKSCLPK